MIRKILCGAASVAAFLFWFPIIVGALIAVLTAFIWIIEKFSVWIVHITALHPTPAWGLWAIVAMLGVLWIWVGIDAAKWVHKKCSVQTQRGEQ